MKNSLPLFALAFAASAAAQIRAPELPGLVQFVRLAKESLAPAVPAARAQTAPAARDFFDVLRDNHIDAGLAADLPHRKMAVHILAADTNIYSNNSRTFPPTGPEGVCEITVIHPLSSRAAMIHQDATIPLKYVRPFDGPDYTFLRVLLHEATHCDMYDQEGSHEKEIRGDIFAARALMQLPGGAQEARIQKYKRAVRAMLGEGVSHALALPLDAQEKGEPLPDPAAVAAAHLALYEMLYAEHILDPDMHGYRYEDEGDLLRAVYGFMKRGLAAGHFDRDALMKRSAEMYVEGVDTLAPAMMAAHPAALRE